MATEQPTRYRLDDEQCARVKDCLRKEGLPLPVDHLERFIRGIEASVAHFLATPPEGTFRDAHDALRDLWELSHEDDPSIARLWARLGSVPNQAIEQLGRRARVVIPRLFAGETIGDEPFDPPERLGTRFLEWAANADGQKLVAALQVMAAEGGRIVKGRSRDGGKRSGLRLEPVIVGEVRGAGTARHHGGRPRKNATKRSSCTWRLTGLTRPVSRRSAAVATVPALATWCTASSNGSGSRKGTRLMRYVDIGRSPRHLRHASHLRIFCVGMA